VRGLLQRDLHAVAQVGAAVDLRTAAAAPPPAAAEDVAEDVAERFGEAAAANPPPPPPAMFGSTPAWPYWS
jgi:hypothetical protein